MVLLYLVCNFQFVCQIDTFMLLAATKCKHSNYFKDIFQVFLERQVKACNAILDRLCWRLVDGSLGQAFQEILQEKGRCQKHLFLISALHIAVRTGQSVDVEETGEKGFFQLFDVCAQNFNFIHAVIQFTWYDFRCKSTSVNFPAERSKRYSTIIHFLLFCASGMDKNNFFC